MSGFQSQLKRDLSKKVEIVVDDVPVQPASAILWPLSCALSMPLLYVAPRAAASGRLAARRLCHGGQEI
jgi:hypothetical protein